MIAALAVACFFATLLAKGDSLSCTVCSSINDTSCTGDLRTCDGSNDTCVTSITETVLDGQRTSILSRACGKSRDCSKTGSLSTKQMSIKYSIGCCTSDGCTPDVPLLPSPSSSPNGVICPACFTTSSSSCNTSETITCTGDEKKCISYAILTTGRVSSTVALHGCATQSVCDSGSSSTAAEGVTAMIDLTCTDSSISLERGVLLPAIAALFLLKIVF